LREVHETPAWASEQMARMGGWNRFDEPNLRVVWSNSRLGFVGGKFEERDEEGYLLREVFKLQRMPKYPVENRWIIEQWVAPEKFGTPETWMAKTKEYGEEGNIPQLGPYPSRGDYQLCCVLETPDREFLQLSVDVLEDVATGFRLKRAITYMQGLLAEKSAIEKRKQEKIDDDAEWVKNEMRSELFLQPAVTVL
jgi:hypothetical protein